MANVFDQFDAPAATAPAPGAPAAPPAANEFDQFDAPSHANVFDQFDAPKQSYLGATASAAGQAAMKGVGNTLQGVGAVAETMPLTGVSFYNPPVWARPDTDPTAQAQKERTALLGKPVELLQTIRQDPIYQAGASLAEAAPKLLPVDPQRATQLGPRVGAMAGGFVPLLASGPAAPVTIGLQAMGAHLNDDFEAGKAQGLSDEDAAARTMNRATASGVLQSTVFLALPKPLQAAGEKWITDKFGSTVLQRFLAGRVALGAEGAVLGGTSTAAENVATGQPVTKGVGPGALGLGLAGALMPPYLPGRSPVGAPAGGEQLPAKSEQVAAGPASQGVPQAPAVAPDVLSDIQQALTGKQVPRPTGTIVPPVDTGPDKNLTDSGQAPGAPLGQPKSGTIVPEMAELAQKSNLPVQPIALEETPLGVNRPERPDPSLAVLSDNEFDQHYRAARQGVDVAERQLDQVGDPSELTTEQRQNIADAQDLWSAASLERFRRNAVDTDPRDLFSDLKDVAGTAVQQGPGSSAYAKAQILIDELRRQGVSNKDVLSGIQLTSPDAAEVFKADLGDIKKLTGAPPDETTEPGAAAETNTGQNERTGSEATAATTSAAEPMPAEGASRTGEQPPQRPPPALRDIPDKIIQRDLRAEADPVIDHLNSLKVDTNGSLHAFGLVPDLWNKLIDTVILGVRGGRAIRDAVSWAFEKFKGENPGVQFDEAGARTHFVETKIGNLRYEQKGESPTSGDQGTAPAQARAAEGATATAAAPAVDKGYENLKRVAAEKAAALETARQQIATARDRSQPVTADMLQRQRAAKQQDLAARKALNEHPVRAADLIKESVAASKELEAARQSGDRERIANANTRFEMARAAEEQVPAHVHQKAYNDLVGRGELPAMKAFPGFEGQRGGPRFADPLPRPQESALPFKRYFGLEDWKSPRVRDVIDGLNLARQRLIAGWGKRPIAGQMTYLWDGAMNLSRGVARQTSNIVLHELNREFGEDKIERRTPTREAALSFATEADGDISRMQEMREKILASDFAQKKTGRQALAAIDYAEKFWDRFNTPNDRRSGLSLVELQQELTAMERGTELNNGLDVPEWQSPYIMHATVPEEAGVLVKQQQGGGISQKFTRKRMNPTLADDVAEGIPLRSLSAIDLLEQRVRYGQENVNAISWMHSLRDIHDPTTKQPLVTDVIPRTRADGSHYDDAPPGYSAVNVGRVKFSMLNGYDGVFGDLTDPSWFSKGSLRRGTQQVFGALKHVVTLADTMHLGVEATRKFLLTGNFGYSKGLTLIDNTPREIQLMADRGEIPEEWTSDLLEDKRKLDLLVKQGTNLQDLSSNLHQNWVQKIPLAGTFNKWLFSRYVRGAMAEAALMKFDQVARPGEDEAVTARRVGKDINEIFGNIGNQGWVRSKTGQDLMRTLMFAPYWNETLLRTEAGGAGQLLGDLKRTVSGQPALNAKAQVILAGTAGLFLANQIINLATRGKPTWENPEEGFGAKISAYLPDVIGHGPGFFLNPFSLSMKLTHLAATKLERNWEEAHPKNLAEAGGTLARAGAEILQSRLTQPFRAGLVPVTRRDAFGRPLRNEDLLPEMARTLTPLPISAPAVVQAAKQAVTGQHSEAYRGQFQRQVFSSGGVLLDQAPTPGLRIARLASAFNAKLGKAPDTAGEPHGDFQQLDSAVERGNETDTQSALRDLLDRRTAQQITQHYQRWANQPFTGSLQREAQFKQSLTPEQMQQYTLARNTRAKLRNVVGGLLPQAESQNR